ncbi:Hint domain-containing protein [Sedimentitalea sp.]|uniref:Hint domain-containing protein n=1 Tax=Sedimentitalea sp. TaxID=2048915 RepID=UPI0032991E29
MKRRPDRHAKATQLKSHEQRPSHWHISTTAGDVCATELRIGNRVITRDHGVQVIAWIGRCELSAANLEHSPLLGPVQIAANALGQGLPEQDMIVSPYTRVLVKQDDTALYFGDDTLLVPARNLVGLEGVEHLDDESVSYVHIAFEQHEVVRANGIWIECFQPADPHVFGIGEAQRTEMLALYPELTEACLAPVA